MKKSFALAVFLSASPLAAQQVVPVQSGEHDTFSRLVLRVGPSAKWQVVEEPGSASIVFPGQDLTFSTTSIFDLIPHERIAEVTEHRKEGDSVLDLMLNCKCEVQVSGFQENYIIVDVLDGPELAPVETATSDPMWQPDSLPFVQAPDLPARFTGYVMAQAPAQPQLLPDPPRTEPEPEPEIAAHQLEVPDEAHDTVARMGETTAAIVSDINTKVQVEDDPAMRARLEAAQNQLLEQLARAADQGLVDFVQAPVPVAEVKEVAPEPDPQAEPESPVIDPELAQQLSAKTAYSNGTEEALSEIVNQFAMPQCLDDDVFAIEAGEESRGFSESLANLRRDLLGEFDDENREVKARLVHLYLRYGLGAEADLILREGGEGIENALVYRDMAHIIEGEMESITGPVSKGAGCGGAHEMWFLAAGLGDNPVLDPLSVTEAFSTYPIEVRTQIGPPLSNAFLARGQVDAAHVVLEIVRRADGDVTAAQKLAEARVLERQANTAGAEQIYQEIAATTDELAPDAMIELAKSVIETGQTVPSSLLLDLESAAFFNRDTEKADSLRLWEIRARAQVEGPVAALHQIRENILNRPQISDDLRDIAAGIFENSSAAEVGDYDYAQMVLEYADLLSEGSEGDMARLKIAEEMAGIGLPETALDILEPNLSRPDRATNRLVAAAYVQLFEPEMALEILKGDESLEAYKILIQANLQMEDFQAVVKLLEDPRAAQISLNDVALRAGDWAKIREAGAVGTLASYMNGGEGSSPLAAEGDGLVPMPLEEEASLKAARRILEINRQGRNVLEEVLATPEQ